MKCGINQISQRRCNRKATTTRNTGRATVHLCAQCDERFGAIVGAGLVGRPQALAAPAEAADGHVVDRLMKRHALINRPPADADPTVPGTLVFVVCADHTKQRQAAATAFSKRAQAIAIPIVVVGATSLGRCEFPKTLRVRMHNETVVGSNGKLVDRYPLLERVFVDQAAAQRKANELNLERATVLEAEAAQLRAAIVNTPATFVANAIAADLVDGDRFDYVVLSSARSFVQAAVCTRPGYFRRDGETGENAIVGLETPVRIVGR